MASYLLQSSITLSVLYLTYWLFLRQLTFFEWNRLYLLLTLFLSVLLPLLNLAYLLPPQPILNYQLTLNTILIRNTLSNLPVQESIDWQRTMQIIYLVGIALGTIRIGFQIFSLLSLKKRAEYNVSLACWVLNETITPFSFFRWIFINPNLHTNTELKAILTHESIHVRQIHTIDILLAECVTTVFWFNPFAWKIRATINQNLEFLTDQVVLRSGITRKDYQYNLLKISNVNNTLPITNYFNTKHLKTRINMMNRTPSKTLQLLRFAICIPLVVLLSLVFNQTSVAQLMNKKEEPTNSYYKVASAYYQEKDYINALEYAQKAIKQDDDAYTQNLLGLIFTQIKRFDLAESHLNKAITLNPNFADPFINKAHLLSLQNNDNESIKLLEKALTIDAKEMAIYKNLGVAYDHSGNWQKAIEIWKQASTLFPSEPGEFDFNIGLKYAQHQQIDEGLKWIKLGAKKGSISAIDALKAKGLWDEKEVLSGK